MVLGITACGGGGSGIVRLPPSPPPQSNPPSQNYDPANNQLLPTGVAAAHAAGFTGAGVKIGIMGFGADPTTPPLVGRIAWFKSYLSGGSQTPNDDYGHGTVVADILGGLSRGVVRGGETFPGGVAPGASLYDEQVCKSDDTCSWHVDNFQDFVAEQVRAINISAGQPNAAGTVLNYFSGPYEHQQIAAAQAIYQPAVDAGIVLVWAAMNAGQPQPSVQAGLPYWVPSFQPNWLAVVNIEIGGDGKPHGLWRGSEEPSNACGVAAEWCLGAPGRVYTPTPNFATIFWEGGIGTSFAAPIVTGTVALVLQAYPWMSAGDVTDTVLTTATPIDDGSHMTPNATYGWGMVNAVKAVHGPAQFAFPGFGPFVADIPSGVTSTFSNDIGGPGGLKLTGPGTLVLTGSNTFASGSEVAAGTLTINGSIASDVTIDVGGDLNGSGTIKANVTNAGTITSSGTGPVQGLAVTGNLTDQLGSTTAVALGDPLIVGGTAALAGKMIVLAAPASYTVQSTEPLVNAGQISGTFQSLAFATGVFYTGTLSYTSRQVSVALTQNNIHAAAVSMAPLASVQTLHSAADVQKAIDVSNDWSATGQATEHAAWMRDAGYFLVAATPESAVTSLDSLSGEIYATSRAVEAEQALATDKAVANREHALARHENAGLWVQALGADGALARAGYDAADYRAGGTLLGFDGSLTSHWAVGAAVGRTRVWANMHGLGGRVHAREGVGEGYARWHSEAGWYVAGRASYANVNNVVMRGILLGSNLLHVDGAHKDHLAMATIEGGKTIHFGKTSLTPWASFGGLRLHQGVLAERGSAMGLVAPSQEHDIDFATVGLRYGTGFKWVLGRSFVDVNVAYRRTLSGANMSMRTSFTGMPNVLFMAQGQNLPTNVGMLGMRVSTAVGLHWGWFVDVDYKAGNAGVHQAAADVGIRVTP
ncbi:MAG TPA: autotransporter domain-containing protein [Rhodanobacteraceae bacterium]